MKITEKLKELLAPEDLKVFEAAIEKLIAQKVSLKEEEIKAKYDELAEEYVQKKLAEDTEALKASLFEEYDGKIKQIEKKVITKLGSFLDHVIVEQITDATIEKLAINEIALPVVEGIKKVFSSNYVELDSDGSAMVKAEQKKRLEAEKALSSANEKIMESEERLEKSATFLLISEATQGLTNTQKARVSKMFKNKRFDDVKENIETFVEMVKESAEPKAKTGKGIMDEIITEADTIVEEKTVISEGEDNETFATRANRYMDD